MENRIEGYNLENGNIDYISLLENFLKNKRILTKFREQYKKHCYYGNELAYVQMERCSARSLLESFDWSATAEGFNYWYKINTEWLEFIGIFGGYYSPMQYKEARKKVEVFKSLLNGIIEDFFEEFKNHFIMDNEQLEHFIDETLTKTFLARHSYSEIFSIWTDGYGSVVFNKEDWNKVLDSLNIVDYVESAMTVPQFRAEALLKYTKVAK